MDAEDEGTAEEAGGTDMGFWSGWCQCWQMGMEEVG